MLTKDYMPGGEYHVFRGTEWQFSIAQLHLAKVSQSAHKTLAHQFCIRAPHMSHGTFDLRDIKQVDPFAAWDPHLRLGRLLHVLNASFPRAEDLVREIRQFVRPLHEAARSKVTPSPGDAMAIQGAWV